MNTQRRPTSLDPIRFAWTRFAWLACCLILFAAGAQARRVEGDRAVAQGLYEAEVPVSSQTVRPIDSRVRTADWPAASSAP